MIPYGSVTLRWDDKPVILVGTGPSLKDFDLSKLRGYGYVLAVKEAIWDLPFADACFGLDMPWMRRQGDRLEEVARRIPVYLAVPDQEQPPISRYTPSAIYLKRLRTSEGFSDDPGAVESGGNSGFGAANVAYLAKARDIVLLGYDYKGEPYCPERYTHHPRGHNARYLPKWGENFRAVAPVLKRKGVRVVNASKWSTVDAFDKIELGDALEYLDRVRSQGDGGLCRSA